MNRRSFLLSMGFGVLTFSSGCTGTDLEQTNAQTTTRKMPTTTEEVSTTPRSTTTKTTRRTTTTRKTTAQTTTQKQFLPGVYFPTCSSVTIHSKSFSQVVLKFINDGEQTFKGDFTGNVTFKGSGQYRNESISRVTVYEGNREYSRENPRFDSCTATTTEKTTTTKKTTTETVTSTPTTTAKPEVEIDSRMDRVNVGKSSEKIVVEGTITNTNNYEIGAAVYVILIANGDRKMSLGRKEEMSLPSGEEWSFRYSYGDQSYGWFDEVDDYDLNHRIYTD